MDPVLVPTIRADKVRADAEAPPHRRTVRRSRVARWAMVAVPFLVLAGAAILSEKRVSCVEIEDFYPKGNIFAVGVTGATPDVRMGSEVAVVHGGSVRAVGVSRLHHREMVELSRGEAVRVRHRAVAPNS